MHRVTLLLPRWALLSLLASILLSTPAWARREYFDQICATCHSGIYRGSPGDSPTCAGCHYHAGFTRTSRGTRRFHGWTDKKVYEAGEIVTVFITGGDRPGWVRTHVVDQDGKELARATGPTGMGDDSDPNWTASLLPGPIVLETRAPYLPGTYEWKVGWFGDVAYPNPAPILEHQGMQLRWDDVPLPSFDVYSNDSQGPAVTALTVAPSPTGGVREVRISALASDAGTGRTPLRGASYMLECMGGSVTSGDWAPLRAADGTFDSADEPVTGTGVVSAVEPA